MLRGFLPGAPGAEFAPGGLDFPPYNNLIRSWPDPIGNGLHFASGRGRISVEGQCWNQGNSCA